MARASGTDPAPLFFEAPEEFRAWLAKHHASATELWVGYWKVATGKPSLTWPQSVDEALCYGWIDGLRKSLGKDSYKIRFTPRKPTSHWSAVNVRRVPELEKEGRMTPAGRAAFARRDEAKTALHSYEARAAAAFAPADARAFRANRAAWAWFEAEAPSYRRAATHWVTSAKRPETRAKRLAELVAASAGNRRVKPLESPSRRRARGA